MTIWTDTIALAAGAPAATTHPAAPRPAVHPALARALVAPTAWSCNPKSNLVLPSP